MRQGGRREEAVACWEMFNHGLSGKKQITTLVRKGLPIADRHGFTVSPWS